MHSTLKLPQQLMTLIKMLQQILPLSVYHHITANKTNWKHVTKSITGEGLECVYVIKMTHRHCDSTQEHEKKNLKKASKNSNWSNHSKLHSKRERSLKELVILNFHFNTKQTKDVDLTLAVENSRPNAKSRNTTPNWATVSTYIPK